MQRNPVQEWPQCNYDEYKKRKTSKGAHPRRPPTTDKSDRKHDRQCLDSLDKRA